MYVSFQLPCHYDVYELVERRVLALSVSFVLIIVFTGIWSVNWSSLDFHTDKIVSSLQRLHHWIKHISPGIGP